MLSKFLYRLQVLKRLSKFAKGVKRFFYIYFGGNLIELVLELILPIFYSLFIEKIILGKKINIFWIVIMGYITVQIVSFIVAYMKNYCRYRMTNHVTVNMRERIITNYLNRVFAATEKTSATDAKMVMDDDMNKLTEFANSQSTDYIVNVGKMIILGIILFVMEWRLAVICIAVVPITFLLTEMYGRRSQKIQNISRVNDAKWGDWLYSIISGWREVRAMNLQNQGKEVFRNYSQKDAIYFTKVTNYWVIRNQILPKIKDEFLMQFLVYFLGGILIYYNQISIGVLLVFAQYYIMLSTAVQDVTRADAELQSNIDFYERVLNAAEEENYHNNNEIKQFESTALEIKNISFRYPKGEKNVFEKFSLSIQQGERIGIIGESGKGKTTLLNLLVGALQPDTGEIYFGGVNLRNADLREVHKKIGFVMQDNVLFNTSIKENLKYGKEDATEEEMKQACKKAYIYDFIQNLPQEFDTVIGEDGIKLSGGQKQRIVLARLFLKDVDIFIFDEATSALDQHAESIVHDAIREIEREKTLIIVSHRKSSLNLCNRIISL
jgi:ATP-binding cassette subfamily B protein/subfamily B ATP-binding cassette protein MsbA